MPISWMTAFKVIPWADVVSATPTVVKGAKKLWSTVKTQTTEAEAQHQQVEEIERQALSQNERLSAIEGQVRVLEQRTRELGEEAMSSSEVIRSLAEQNSRLVSAIEILRVRTRVLLLLSTGLGIGLLSVVVWVLLR